MDGKGGRSMTGNLDRGLQKSQMGGLLLAVAGKDAFASLPCDWLPSDVYDFVIRYSIYGLAR